MASAIISFAGISESDDEPRLQLLDRRLQHLAVRRRGRDGFTGSGGGVELMRHQIGAPRQIGGK